MVELIWTEPALSDLDAIADDIAVEDPEAARGLVQRVVQHVEQLARYPESSSRYRQIGEPPCRVFYRYDGDSFMWIPLRRFAARARSQNGA
jgi:plasmid stabilization system protein ParE